ncbi:Uncharacterised protein [Serratia marcescens]|uniref:hypothetical protein n=1 Tax=Enterobacterales TaxID=91347 RepID=UPI0007452EC5|nr:MULTISPECIES: hypothetical protein [Yersiniaceae]CVB05417.1 Uncharacterised protein [Serratia marcescens]
MKKTFTNEELEYIVAEQPESKIGIMAAEILKLRNKNMTLVGYLDIGALHEEFTAGGMWAKNIYGSLNTPIFIVNQPGLKTVQGPVIN